ncbi:hypothetical protein AB0L10_39770 [Streptomyces flaveolus]|uniref:hypothetical protein n=1 Tax=Streptomyces flaveolus TaxID=67297 RepID=UPI003440BFD6
MSWVEQFTREDATRYDWSHDLTWRVRTGVNIVLGFLQAPGAALTADDVAVLMEVNLPHGHTSAVLERAGLLICDRVPAVLAWAEQQITAPPGPGRRGTVADSTVPPRRQPAPS